MQTDPTEPRTRLGLGLGLRAEPQTRASVEEDVTARRRSPWQSPPNQMLIHSEGPLGLPLRREAHETRGRLPRQTTPRNDGSSADGLARTLNLSSLFSWRSWRLGGSCSARGPC